MPVVAQLAAVVLRVALTVVRVLQNFGLAYGIINVFPFHDDVA